MGNQTIKEHTMIIDYTIEKVSFRQKEALKAFGKDMMGYASIFVNGEDDLYDVTFQAVYYNDLRILKRYERELIK